MSTTIQNVTSTPVTFAGAYLVGYTEHPRMSQETTAFDAEVHIDGQQVGTLSNAGHGGESLFTPSSTEGHRAFTAAEQAFPGTPDVLGQTMPLIDALAESAALAKDLGGRSTSFVPNMTVSDMLTSDEGIPAYSITLRKGESAHDVAHEIMGQAPEVQTLTYPVRAQGGYWLHTVTR